MEYRQMGKSGLKLSELSFGSWITFGNDLDIHAARECMYAAYENGVNFFDNAEVYGSGVSELIMGEVLKEFSREQFVVSTKLFWGGSGVNDTGLSKKHIYEGIRNSLKRLQLDYIDLLFCHRPDTSTPIEETVRAMDEAVKQGVVLYWGTSEWSANEILDAYKIAEKINAVPPSMEQPEYNMFNRKKVETEFLPLYKKYGLGTTTWSPLLSGVLTGKYNQGIPEDSRLSKQKQLQTVLSKERIEKVKKLTEIAGDLNCTMAQLAIAWCLLNPNVSTVILGASKKEQVLENLKAVDIKNQITNEISKEIEKVLK